MGKLSKFNKIMSWLVMCGGITTSIVLGVVCFNAAGTIGAELASYSGYSSYYSETYAQLNSTIAGFVWGGIGCILIGSIFSVGIFALWNMLIDWYNNSSRIKSKYCGDTVPMQYGAPVQPAPMPVQSAPAPVQPAPAPVQPAPAPVQRPANWYCPQCGTANDAASGFCANCGQRR